MGLTSARDTPRQESREREVATPTTPTPANLLDTLRKPTGNTTSLKEHERAVDELKKENFDLKLKVYQMEDALRKQTPANLQVISGENESLRAANEALSVEIRSLKELLSDATRSVDQVRRNTAHHADNEAEVDRLRQELEMSNNQLARSVNQIRNYEQQLELFDQESREMLKRTKQLEADLTLTSKKLADSQKISEEQRGEIADLTEELQAKNVFVQQVKEESHSLHSEVEMLTRKNQELEGRVRIVENERDSIKADLDPARRKLFENVHPPGSPRSSMDLVESKLLRQVGDATKRMEILQKSNALSQNEREQLSEQSRRLLGEIGASLRGMAAIFERINVVTGLRGNFTTDTTLDRAVEELGKLCEAVLGEYDDNRRQKDGLALDLRQAHEDLALARHQAEKSREQTRHAQEQLGTFEREYDAIRGQYQKSQNDLVRMEQQLKTTSELELPKYREQCVTLQNAVKTLETELASRDRRQAELRQDAEALRRRCAELEGEASRVSADSALRMEEVQQMRAQRKELLQKLAHSEELSAQASGRLDDVQQQLAHAERLKSALEENFNKELRALHNSNAELKGQLAAVASGKTNNDQRLERAQQSLRMVEQNNEELLTKLKAKDASYSALLREHEVLSVERQTIARELADVQDSLRQSEVEITRLKRMEHNSRRGTEGLEHLQAKVDSTSSLNALLKEQVDAKERLLRDAEDKLRRQDDAIRKAYADCEHQHAKIKKREAVIARVLKRLENINAVAGLSLDDDEAEISGVKEKELRF